MLVRALDDLHQIAVAARDIGPWLTKLQARADSIEEQLGEAIEIARQIEARGREAIGMAERIDARALEIAEPLDGTVERLGRLVDRLPGGARGARAIAKPPSGA